jgi:adenosine deaminase
MSAVIERSVLTLPKAHLHAHLIPSMRTETFRELGERYGVDLADAWAFSSLTEFIPRSLLSFEVLRTPDDLARLCREFVEDEAAQGVAYTEPMVGVGYFSQKFGLSWDEVFAIQDEAFRAASATTGTQVGYLFGVLRHQSAEEAEAIARFAAAHADSGAVGLGIAGDEQIGSLTTFRRAFEIAREAGLLVVPHAGESVGPASVLEALEVLRPDRIAHGVRSVEDPDLLRRLADEGVTCDVCPTSNVKLGVCTDIELHQLPAMLAAGVPVTINADDQLFFGPRIGEEYALVQRSFGLTDGQLAEIARTSARASGAPKPVVASMLEGIDAWLAG